MTECTPEIGYLQSINYDNCRKVPSLVNFFYMTTFCIAFYESYLAIPVTETVGCNSTARAGTTYTTHTQESSQCTTTLQIKQKEICYVRCVILKS
jgi:hypothetical protein